MKIVASAGHPEVAMVYVVEFPNGLVECVEAVQPPRSREEKWVLMISTLFGCPISCQMCDAGGHYRGKLTEPEMFAQIEYLIQQRYPNGFVPSEQFKIQFARMGEPALNMDVIDLLENLPGRINAHRMAKFGEEYYRTGDRKITLNFALAENSPVDADELLRYFDPDRFLIKVTPLNPTYQAESTGLTSYVDPNNEVAIYPELEKIREAGYQVIISIGEQEENRIGSNCGQYVQKHILESGGLTEGYTYQVTQPVSNPE